MPYADYLLVACGERDYGEIREAFRASMQTLDAARDQLPPALYEFMTASWHYDHRDRRAMHDMRLRSLTVREGSGGDSAEAEISIEIVLLGAYFDRELLLTYGGVSRYSIGVPESVRRAPSGSHGDVLDDEVAILAGGEIVHAIEFSRGSLFEIAFRGSFSWGLSNLAS